MYTRRQKRDYHGRFLGFWARLNCENMPVVSAKLVQDYLNDPRRIPYLLIWRERRFGDEVKEALRLSRYIEPSDGRVLDNYIELKRTDMTASVLRVVYRMLPRNGGRALFLNCSYCKKSRRHVYGWEWDSASGWSNRVRTIAWQCRSCARLRYSSEGGYLRPAGLGRLGLFGVMLRSFGSLPRPEMWLPEVFTSIDDPALDWVLRQNRRQQRI